MKNYDVRLSSIAQRASDLVIFFLIIAFLMLPLVITLHMPMYKQQAVTPLNPIQIENQLPLTTTWQLTNPALYQYGRFADIEGYPWVESAIAGDTLSFSVSTTAPSFTAEMYRLGWYGGTGGRLKKSIASIPGRFYPLPPIDAQTGMVDAHWPRSLLFVHGDTTDQAYNPWGGKSLYEFNSYNGKRAYKVSFSRPLANKGSPGWGNLFRWEYPMIGYLEKQAYDLGYVASVATHTDADIFKHHAGVLIVGHQEYWTKESRDHLRICKIVSSYAIKMLHVIP